MERKYYRVNWTEKFYDDSYTQRKTIIGVARDSNGRLLIRKLAGKNMPVKFLRAFVKSLPSEWVIEGENKLKGMALHWCVYFYEGRSECRDYYFSVSEDPVFKEWVRIYNVLHVSMYGKIQKQWEGDVDEFVAIIAEIIHDYPQEDDCCDINEIWPEEYKMKKMGEGSRILEELGYEEEEEELSEGEMAERQYAEYANEVVEEED